MAAKTNSSPIETAAREFIRILRDRVERPAQQCILALERIATLDLNNPEIEKQCARGLSDAAAGVRSINLSGMINQMYELERNLTRIAGKAAK
jgi:hypothetical protein